MKTVDFSETIAVRDLKVCRTRHLIEFMKVSEIREIFGSMNHLGFLFFSGPSMTYYHRLRTCADGDSQRILNAVCVTNQAP